MKEFVRALLHRCGFELVRYGLIDGKPPRLRDLSDADMTIIEAFFTRNWPHFF